MCLADCSLVKCLRHYLPDKMLQLLGAGKQQTKWENVDLEKMLSDCGLKVLFDVDEWPSVNAVRELATRVKKAAECLPSGDKSARPFVFTGLKQ